MSAPSPNVEFFDLLAKVLLRCILFGFLLLMFWFGIFMLAGDFVRALHGHLFGLSTHELDLIHYSGMGLLKIAIICFFVFPWLAIQLVLKQKVN